MAINVTDLGSFISGTNANQYANDFVAAEAGLLVVVAAGRQSPQRTITYIDVEGTLAALPVSVAAQLQSHALGYREVAAGTYTVTVGFDVASSRCHMTAYLLTGYASATPADTTSNSGASGTSCPLTLDFGAGGTAIYGASLGAAAGISWDGASDDDDQAIESTQFSTAHKTASGDGNVETPSWTGAAAFSGVGAVWLPAAVSGAYPLWTRRGWLSALADTPPVW